MNVYPLILTVFVDLVGFGIVLPLLPLYAQAFGAGPEIVTLVAVSYTLAQSVFGPFWGWLSDRIGRKPVLLFTIFGSLCAYLLLAATTTLWMLFAARFFAGAMAANMGVAHALVTDITRPEDRTTAIARLSGAAGLGFVAGPAIGGLLAGAGGTGLPDFFAPYLAAAAFSAVAFLLAVFLLRESVTTEQRKRARRNRGIAAWLKAGANPQTRLILCLMFLTPFVFAGIEVIIVLWSERVWDWGPRENGYFYTWMGFCHVALQWFAIGTMARRFRERNMVTMGACSLAAGSLLMALSTGVIGLYLAAFLMIFGVAANTSSLNSLLSRVAEPDERGSLLGLGQTFAGMGRIVGPSLSGLTFVALGTQSPFLVGALTMIVLAVLSRRISLRDATSP